MPADISGDSSSKERSQLLKMLEILREGDTVVVYKLDRLGRSLRKLVNLITQLEERKIEFISLKDAIDTSTVQGTFFLNIFASLAEFERDIIREHTRAGLSAARARGRMGGKKRT
ncbi:recombinase family protein [Dyadobacter sp. LHD-138]|uniref:recombinase family protein n=1 Tax=Dyadobacter sp. LHD-138 TaxID=3071413 RepID=UPI0027DFE6EE|nr:recombinase family protein [Dyadobacter sp. LHD-138]MDQ6479552.1 recombinase family protein [Dyadobacter sp. LHD-138]